MAKNQTKNTGSGWDSDENEAQNNFVSWGDIGDRVYGTLVAVKEVASTLPDKKGEKQKVYEMKVEEGVYHNLDEKKRVIEPGVELSKGDIISIGGRSTIDTRMARIKVGQIFGLKFTEELPAKTRGYNATKLIKVYTPKNAKGEYLMDEDFLAEKDEEESDDMGGF